LPIGAAQTRAADRPPARAARFPIHPPSR
jgi:hypothetical protein